MSLYSDNDSYKSLDNNDNVNKNILIQQDLDLSGSVKSRHIRTMIKYFETYYKITAQKSKMLILFMSIVLNYYKNKCVLIDYSSNISSKYKFKIMKDITQKQFSEKLFDLVDFMFKTIKKILDEININEINIDEINIYINVYILFYITFYSVFPQDLKDILSRELNLTDIENNIIKKCIQKTYNDDSDKFNFISDNQKNFLQNLSTKSTNTIVNVKTLNNHKSIIILFNIILKLRKINV